MKIYLVIENIDIGFGGYMPRDIHGVFKSKEKAEELKNKLLDEHEQWVLQTPWEIFYLSEMELQE